MTVKAHGQLTHLPMSGCCRTDGVGNLLRMFDGFADERVDVGRWCFESGTPAMGLPSSSFTGSRVLDRHGTELRRNWLIVGSRSPAQTCEAMGSPARPRFVPIMHSNPSARS